MVTCLRIVFVLIPLGLIGQQDLNRCWNVDYTMYPREINVSTRNGEFNEVQMATQRPVAKLHQVHEGDVTFSRRVWSQIELKEKQNHLLYYPLQPQPNKWSLWTVIRYSLEVDMSLTAYSPHGLEQDDSFKYPIHPADSSYCDQLEDILYQTVYVDSLDEDGNAVYDSITETTVQKQIREPIESEDIVRYIIKEDWFFDRERSQMEKRIIGIAPVIYVYDEFGDVKGVSTLFWLYFPECEYVFHAYAAQIRDFEPKVLTFTDIFRRRMFSTSIFKDSSMPNSSINGKFDGKDALLESECLKKKHETMEHDLWSY